jgi:hypothetical protein
MKATAPLVDYLAAEVTDGVTSLTGDGCWDIVAKQFRSLRMKTAHACLSVAALLAQLAACDTRAAPASAADASAAPAADASADASAAPSADEACQDWAQANCSKLNECSPPLGGEYSASPGAVVQIYQDFAGCLVREKLFCNVLIDADTTASRMQSCAKAVLPQSCGEFEVALKPTDCPAGSRPSGTPCVANVQCQSGFCRNALGPQRRTIVFSTGEPGQPGQPPCGVCSSTLPSPRPSPPGRGLDEACTRDNQYGGECNKALRCISWTCVAPLGEGALCDPGHESCDSGLRCAPGPSGPGSVCTPFVLTTARPGESCRGRDIKCIGSSYCEYQTTCGGGTADGDICHTSCVPPAQCLGGQCVLPTAASCR